MLEDVGTRARDLALIMIATTAACSKADRNAAVPPCAGCPSDEALHRIHLAMHLIERGGKVAEVRREVDKARGLVASGSAEWRSFVGRLDDVAAMAAIGSELAEIESAALRVEFHESCCIRDDWHEDSLRGLEGPGGAAPH